MSRYWRDNSRCRDEDPELFYPTGIATDGDLVTMQAKAVCRRCQVNDKCLAYALDRGEQWGVWGGLTPTERRRLAVNRVLSEQFPPTAELEREAVTIPC